MKFATLHYFVILAILQNKLFSSSVVFAIVQLKEKCQPKTFDYYNHDRSFGYSCSNFRHFPDNTEFPNSSYVKVLEFEQNNFLEKLKNGDLLGAGLPNLLFLNLNSLGIRTIEEGAFSGSPNIIELIIKHNAIEELNPVIFNGLTSLVTLRIRDNSDMDLIANAEFPPLPELRDLSIMECSIHSIPKNLFKNLPNLQLLVLSGNKLKVIDWAVISHLTKLQKILIEYNLFHCDCNIAFILDYADKRDINLNNGDGIHCSRGKKIFLIKKDWMEINPSLLTCPTQISQLSLSLGTKSINFRCDYSGWPVPEIKWMKNGEVLTNDSLFHTRIINVDLDESPKNENSNYTYKFGQDLIMENPEPGNYTCLVSNSDRNYSKAIILNSTNVTVAVKPATSAVTLAPSTTTKAATTLFGTIITAKPEPDIFASVPPLETADKPNDEQTPHSYLHIIALGVTVIVLVIIIFILIGALVASHIYFRKERRNDRNCRQLGVVENPNYIHLRGEDELRDASLLINR